ncbi:MAG: choice-of-anchor R domain-containing protein [Phycisphaerales bacterium]
MRLSWNCGVCAAMSVSVSAACGDVILGNHPPTNDSTQTAAVNNLRRKAMAFAMPAGSDYVVSSITLRLGNYDAADTAFLEIRDHSGVITVPGGIVIGAFTAPPGLGATPDDYVFTPVGTVTLAAGTSYWIYLHGAASPSSFDWKASSPALVPTGIATFGPGNLFTTNSGTSWTNSVTVTTFKIEGSPATGGCYANCDDSTQAPVLNVQDFGCFLTRYAAGEAYANCDDSTQPPVLNVQDFGCFLTKYAAGCP